MQVGYWPLGGLFRFFQRKAIEERRWGNVLYYNGILKAKKMRFDLGINNRFCAYAFLCDSNGLVRWKAVGKASPEELEAMNTVVNKLIKERGHPSSSTGLHKNKNNNDTPEAAANVVDS